MPLGRLPLMPRWAILLLLALGCSETAEPADERAPIEAHGFTGVRIVRREGDVLLFEAEKNGAQCTGEARLSAAGEARIASRCEATGEQAELERRCEAGDAEACAEAAAGVRATHPIDWPKATRLARYACEHGRPGECIHVGLAHELGERGVPQDAGAARAMYERACEAGVQPACARRDALP